MRARNYFVIACLVVLGLGIFFIFGSSPDPAAGPGKTQPTPTLNPGLKLTGENLEGKLAFIREGALWLWKGDNATQIPLGAGNSVIAGQPAKLTMPALGPGNQISYIRQDESFSDLFVATLDGKNLRNLTNNKGKGIPRSEDFNHSSLWAFYPSWSADGSQVAFLSDKEIDYLALWVTPVNNPSPRQISKLGFDQGGMLHPSWAPDGLQIAVSAYDGVKPQIYTININTKRETKLTDTADGAYDPAWSPDGKLIAYNVRKGNNSELWIMRADGTAQTVLVNNLPARAPAWSPDSSKIAFLGLQNGNFEIFTSTLTAGGSGLSGETKQISKDAKVDATGGLSWGK